MINKKEIERAKNIVLEIRNRDMTQAELDQAIEMIIKLKEKLAAVTSGKYYDLPITDDQRALFIEEIKLMKTALQEKAASMDINVGG